MTWGQFITAWIVLSFPLGMLTGRWLRSLTIEFAASRDDRP